LSEDPLAQVEDREVEVTNDGRYAFVRQLNQARLTVVNTEGGEYWYFLRCSRSPTLIGLETRIRENRPLE